MNSASTYSLFLIIFFFVMLSDFENDVPFPGLQPVLNFL